MMRARLQLGKSGGQAAYVSWLSVAAIFFAGCVSKPLDAPTSGDAASAGSPATATPAPGTKTASGPDYEKQTYPAGPYGVGVGATLEDFAFLGWRDPQAEGTDINAFDTVRLSEFYNPDGQKDTKLIWINASAVWCSVCRSEMTQIRDDGVHATFAPKGVQMIVTLFEDNNAGPAAPLDLQRWAQGFSIDYPLLLDPGFKLGAFFTSDATPLNMLVDARTMQVIDARMGYSMDYWQQIDKLLATL
jgi:hypothetical protein